MKKILIPFLMALIVTLLLTSCLQQHQTMSTPISIKTVLPTPQPTITIAQAPMLTNTPIPTPNFCPKETISSNLLPLKTDTNNEKLIAFTDGADGYDDIYTMNLNGEKRRNITNSPAVDRFPIWSPDGRKIAFVSNRNYPAPNECMNMVSNDCVFEIFLMNRNGADMHQISKGWNLSPIWSPDGKQIAYFHFSPAPSSTPNAYGEREFLSDIYVVNVDGSNLRNLTDKFQPGGFGYPVWNPDSTKLAFERGQGIVVSNSDATESQEYPVGDIDEILSWSADGKYIFYIDFNYDIYRATTDFTSIEKLPLPHKITFSPATDFSPDGKWLAYSYYSNQGITPCRQIRVFNIDTSQDYFVYDYENVGTAITNSLIPLSAAPLFLSSINWIPDDNRLIFTQYVHYDVIFGEFQGLFVINIDGTGLRQINDQGEVSSPSIQP